MKRLPIAAACLMPLLWAGASVLAETPARDTGGLSIYSKNLARHHMGSNLFEFNEKSRTYVPTDLASSWLDDDIATGATPSAGKHFYLITLAEPEIIENFEISSRDLAGTVSLYTADEPAPPGAAAWKPLVRQRPIESVLNQRLGSPLSRISRYVLIETDLAAASPIYSLYLYGDRPAVAYEAAKRSAEVDVAAVLGRSVNPKNSISAAGLYTGARVIYANSPGSTVAWQRAIDDNPETGITLASSSDSTMLLRMGDEQPLKRISVLTNEGAQGRLEFYALGERETAHRASHPEYMQASTAASRGSAEAISLEGMRPVSSIKFDGSNPRGHTDFLPENGRVIAVRWVPASGSEPVTLREMNAFGDMTLANHEVVSRAPIAERTSSDGKSVAGGKETLPPVAEFIPDKSPFLPGPLGPETNVIVLPPEEPLSP